MFQPLTNTTSTTLLHSKMMFALNYLSLLAGFSRFLNSLEEVALAKDCKINKCLHCMFENCIYTLGSHFQTTLVDQNNVVINFS